VLWVDPITCGLTFLIRLLGYGVDNYLSQENRRRNRLVIDDACLTVNEAHFCWVIYIWMRFRRVAIQIDPDNDSSDRIIIEIVKSVK